MGVLMDTERVPLLGGNMAVYSVLVLSARIFGLCEWARFFDCIQ
jgi:hypothetical protein